MLILGTLFNGIATHTNNNFYSANYLFMFDQKTSSELVGLFGKLFNTQFRLGIFTFYPVVQPIVYLVFNLICCAIFGVIQLIYFTKDKLIKKDSLSSESDEPSSTVIKTKQPIKENTTTKTNKNSK